MTTRRDIIAAVRAEFERHKMDVFVSDPPSIAQGGKGIVSGVSQSPSNVHPAEFV